MYSVLCSTCSRLPASSFDWINCTHISLASTSQLCLSPLTKKKNKLQQQQHRTIRIDEQSHKTKFTFEFHNQYHRHWVALQTVKIALHHLIWSVTGLKPRVVRFIFDGLLFQIESPWWNSKFQFYPRTSTTLKPQQKIMKFCTQTKIIIV